MDEGPEEQKVSAKLEHTELNDELKDIRALYTKLEAAQEKFCTVFDVHCKACCGACCEHFTPDVTTLEASFLAFGLITEGKADRVLELLAAPNPNGEGCPLYDKSNAEHHCTVYKWRPLICRLFGAAASDDKNGNPVFRRCKWNEDGHNVPTEVLRAHADVLVEMRTYGMMLEETERESQETSLLPDALPRAIEKIQLLLELEEEQTKNV